MIIPLCFSQRVKQTKATRVPNWQLRLRQARMSIGLNRPRTLRQAYMTTSSCQSHLLFSFLLYTSNYPLFSTQLRIHYEWNFIANSIICLRNYNANSNFGLTPTSYNKVNAGTINMHLRLRQARKVNAGTINMQLRLRQLRLRFKANYMLYSNILSTA